MGAYNEGIQKGEDRMMEQKLMKAILAWARAARLLMDREPAMMSKDEALLVQATQQDMLQLS